MGDSSMRGTNTSQDIRFSDKESKALKGTKFPKEFNERVDMRKVNLTIMRPWVAKTVTDLVGFEDDIVVEYAMGLLEDPDNPMPDPKKMQISLTGFLADKTPEFMLKLWQLLLSAQVSLGGIPAEFLAAKKAELIAKQAEEAEIQSRMLQNSGNAPRRDEQHSGRAIHPSFPEQRRPGPPRESRFNDRGPRRSPPPRDRDGRAYPQHRDDDRGYGGGYGGGRGRDGNGRSNYGGRDQYRGPPPMRDTYQPSSKGRDRRGSESRTPPRRREPPRGRSPSLTPPLKRGSGRRERSESSSRSRSRSPSRSPPPKRRARSESPSRSPDGPRRRTRRDSTSRSPSPPPKKRRAASPVRSPSPPPRRRNRVTRDSTSRSRSRSRSRTPSSITPPRRRKLSRSPSRSVSRTPPRAARSPSPSSDRSRSRSPVRRAGRRVSRSVSPVGAEPKRSKWD